MNYYQEVRNCNGHNNSDSRVDRNNLDFNNESMLGPISESRQICEDVDLGYDAKINALLDEIDQDLEEDLIPSLETKEDVLRNQNEQYEDYYHEFPDEEHEDPDEIPSWYNEMLQKKVRETKRRLSDLSNVVCMVSSSTREVITRIEQDHNTPFCKLDPPKHPSLRKPWTNYWRFNCVTKCNAPSLDEDHAHTADCEILLLEHVSTLTSSRSENIFECEFPDYIMRTVTLFQQFADVTSRDTSLHTEEDDYVDSVYEKPTWTYLKIRSNYKNELQLTVGGKAIKPLITHLKRFFHSGPGRTCNVVSLYCINVKWSQKKGHFPPTFLDGCLELRDKVGPITINYTPKTSINFNSVEAKQLGKTVADFLGTCKETTLIDIGCNFGAVSLMMSHNCDKVIGLNPLQHEVDTAEAVKSFNGIYNVTFITCQPKDVQTKCMPLVKKCISVAMLHLASTYGKNHCVYRALRLLPSIWRIVIYGSFTKEFYKLITILTTKDDEMGDEFLPVRGCMIDKSPSIKDNFDIVVMFERPSLIQKSAQYIKLIGQEVNSKVENWDYNSNDACKFPYKREKIHKPRGKFGGYDSPSEPVKIEAPPSSTEVDSTPYNSIRGTLLRKSRIYDCPSLNSDKEISDGFLKLKTEDALIKPKTEKSSSSQSSSSRRPEFDFLSDSTSSPPPKRPEFDFLEAIVPLKPKSEPFDQKQMKIKKEKSYERSYDDLPMLKPMKWEKPFDQKQLKRKMKDLTKIYDYPTLEEIERQNKSPTVVSQQPKRIHTDHIPLSSVFIAAPPIIKKEKEWSPDHLTRLHNQPFSVKLDRDPHYPPLPKEPPMKLEKNNCYPPLPKDPPIKQEKDSYYPPLPKEPFIKQERAPCPPLPKKIVVDRVQIKREPRSPREKEEGELSSDESNPGLPLANIKSETMDLDSSNVSVKSEAMSVANNSSMSILMSGSIIKNEPIEVDDDDEEPVIIELPKIEPPKIEPIIIKDDPSLDDFENMKTPVHVPAAFISTATHSPSPLSVTANFKTVDGFEFSVKPNQSFLGFKQHETLQSNVIVKQEKLSLKEEPLDRPSSRNSNSSSSSSSSSRRRKMVNGEANDDEIKIIGEKPMKDLRDRLKYVIEDQRDSRKGSSDDLRKLIEQRKNLQKQLVAEDCNYEVAAFSYQRSRSRSGSPVMERGWSRRHRSPSAESYLRHGSPVSPRGARRHSPIYLRTTSAARYSRRSPSPSVRYLKHSPSSPLRYRRSPSPVASRYGRPGFSKYQATYSRSPAASPPPRPRRRSPSYEPYVPASASYRWRRQSPSPPARKNKRSDTVKSPLSARRSSRSPIMPYRNRTRSRSSMSLSPPPNKRQKSEKSDTSDEKKKKKKKKKDLSPKHVGKNLVKEKNKSDKKKESKENEKERERDSKEMLRVKDSGKDKGKDKDRGKIKSKDKTIDNKEKDMDRSKDADVDKSKEKVKTKDNRTDTDEGLDDWDIPALSTLSNKSQSLSSPTSSTSQEKADKS